MVRYQECSHCSHLLSSCLLHTPYPVPSPHRQMWTRRMPQTCRHSFKYTSTIICGGQYMGTVTLLIGSTSQYRQYPKYLDIVVCWNTFIRCVTESEACIHVCRHVLNNGDQTAEPCDGSAGGSSTRGTCQGPAATCPAATGPAATYPAATCGARGHGRAAAEPGPVRAAVRGAVPRPADHPHLAARRRVRPPVRGRASTIEPSWCFHNLLGPSPGWKSLLALSHLRNY